MITVAEACAVLQCHLIAAGEAALTYNVFPEGDGWFVTDGRRCAGMYFEEAGRTMARQLNEQRSRAYGRPLLPSEQFIVVPPLKPLRIEIARWISGELVRRAALCSRDEQKRKACLMAKAASYNEYAAKVKEEP